jgi:hypothetical protein
VKGDVSHGAAFGAEKMGVLLQVGAITGGFALMIDRTHEAGGCQSFEAIIDRCQRRLKACGT